MVLVPFVLLGDEDATGIPPVLSPPRLEVCGFGYVLASIEVVCPDAEVNDGALAVHTVKG